MDMLENLKQGKDNLLDKVKQNNSMIVDKMKQKIGDVEGLDNLLPLSIAPARPPEEKSWQEHAEEEVCALFPTLTWKERMIGCLSCMGVGYILSFGSFFRLKALLMGDPVPFVSIATLGNCVSLSGSCFLAGPRNQVKRMCQKTRRISAIVYLLSLCTTLGVSFAPDFKAKALIVVFLMILQYLSIGWYCLSYVPFAREGVKKCFRRLWNELLED